MMPICCRDNLHTVSAAEATWSIDFQERVGLDESGLVMGRGTPLVRCDPATRRLNLNADRDRCIALLSIALRRSVAPGIFEHVKAAALHWQGGDKVLANLRLTFADLPKLDNPTDANRLQAAGYLLDEGIPPRVLLKELGLDPLALDLGKYDPDQPRIPAGSGRESGRWTDGRGGGAGSDQSADQNGPDRPMPGIVQIAADGPLKPGGLNVVPLPGIDPLDPKGLNKPLSPLEQRVIADTVNTIIAPTPADILTLNPHPYDNNPDPKTGAVLPPGIGGYTTYYARSAGAPPGAMRVLIDRAGSIYYSNNHYKSFYPVDIRIVPRKMF